MSEKILFVDEDMHALETFKTMLRKHCDVTTVSSPEQALKIIQTSGQFAVVVSGLKLKKVDGFLFLAKVKETSPEIVRIILTGYADVATAIKALNEGHVFRFLTKPCTPETLIKALAAGIKQYHTIIAEKEILQKTLRGSVRVLIEALSLANPAAYGRTRRVRNLVKNLAKSLGKKVSWELDLASMLSHIGCMSIPRKILDDITTGKELSKSDIQLYNNHPAVGANLLEQIPRLESIAAIVAAQFQEFNPLQSEGARFLKVAVEYDMLMSKGLAPYEAYGRMLACNQCYDPVLLDALEKCIAEEGGYALKFVTIEELEVDMVLEEDIVSRNGLLILTKGSMLNQHTIEAVFKTNETFNIVEPITVVMPSKIGRIDLTSIITSLVALFKYQITSKGIDFALSLDPALPPSFIGGEDHIKQILFNLLSNAFKFSESGQISVCVSPLLGSAPCTYSKLLFIVSDSGPGMSDENVLAVFESTETPVAQIQRNTQRKILGLSIVRRLVELMNGTLCIDSTVGLGTDIYFTIDVSGQNGTA